MPNNAEDYVHRIGRTGRAGAKGTSHSFFTAANGRLARDIIKVMREANQVVSPQLEQLAATSAGAAPSKWPGALNVNRACLRKNVVMCSCMLKGLGLGECLPWLGGARLSPVWFSCVGCLQWL